MVGVMDMLAVFSGYKILISDELTYTFYIGSTPPPHAGKQYKKVQLQ